jgi:hypothetical protein
MLLSLKRIICSAVIPAKISMGRQEKPVRFFLRDDKTDR